MKNKTPTVKSALDYTTSLNPVHLVIVAKLVDGSMVILNSDMSESDRVYLLERAKHAILAQYDNSPEVIT